MADGSRVAVDVAVDVGVGVGVADAVGRVVPLRLGLLLVAGAAVAGAVVAGAVVTGAALADDARDAGRVEGGELVLGVEIACGSEACAAPILSACCSARALVHAATTATTIAVTAPRRARLDLRRDVHGAKIACHIRIWAEKAATTTVRVMERARHSTRNFSSFPVFLAARAVDRR